MAHRLLGVVPLELLGHDVDDVGQRLGRGLHVEEGEAQAPRDHVHRRARVLAHAVPDELQHLWPVSQVSDNYLIDNAI